MHYAPLFCFGRLTLDQRPHTRVALNLRRVLEPERDAVAVAHRACRQREGVLLTHGSPLVCWVDQLHQPFVFDTGPPEHGPPDEQATEQAIARSPAN